MSKGFLTIHIGPHKTGCLVDNREKLLDAGVFYPAIGQEFLFGHHNLVKSIARKDDVQIDRLLASVPANARHILLSSENFSAISVESIKYMASRFSAFTVNIVYFKRDPESLLFSNWQESIKHGGVASWAEYFLGHLTHPYRSEIINPNLVLDKYSDVLGKESIRIIDYEEVMRQGEDIAVVLSRQVNADIDVKLQDKDVNKSMHSAVIEILRVLNQSFANENKLNKSNVREAFFRVTGKMAVKPRVKELLGIVCEYNVPYTLCGSSVVTLLENQFSKKYGHNGINSSNPYGGGFGGNYPASGWLCDARGSELLAWLKDRVGENLS
jgi:hypothetical protein